MKFLATPLNIGNNKHIYKSWMDRKDMSQRIFDYWYGYAISSHCTPIRQSYTHSHMCILVILEMHQSQFQRESQA